MRGWIAVAVVGAVLAVIGVGSASGERPADKPAPACAIPELTIPRDPANPLALPTAPTNGDPLFGAHFFVDGPRHGQAAGAIAQMLGMNPMSFPDSYSWSQFQTTYGSMFNPQELALAKIAGQQETQDISLYAEGGGPGAIYAQTTKILCDNAAADPNPVTVPVFSTFFIYPNGQFCPNLPALQRWQGTFKRDVNEMASAVGWRRAVIFMEIDSIGTSGCLKKKPLKLWLHDLSWEAKTFGALSHAVVYEEAGSRYVLTHTFIAEGYRGRGLSQVLLRGVLEDLKARHITVTNYCPILDRFIEKNSEYIPLIDSGKPGNWLKNHPASTAERNLA